jgi:hypothetical protein
VDNKELFNLCTSPDIVRVIKSLRRRWIVHVPRIGKLENICIHVCMYIYVILSESRAWVGA